MDKSIKMRSPDGILCSSENDVYPPHAEVRMNLRRNLELKRSQKSQHKVRYFVKFKSFRIRLPGIKLNKKPRS